MDEIHSEDDWKSSGDSIRVHTDRSISNVAWILSEGSIDQLGNATQIRLNNRPSDLAKRLERNPPLSYESFQKEGEIELHLPHKKFLETIDEKKEIAEPLTGLTEKQEEIRRKVSKPYYPIPDVQDKPYETPRKSILIKERPFKPYVLQKGRVLEEESPSESKKPYPPVFADQLELIQNLQSNPEIGFYYMIYAVDRSSEFFNPYALK